jgi:ATP-dependent DNA ligase
VIPEGEYGAGGVIVWDHGTYANRTEYEMTRCLGRGHLSFRLDGEKLRGGYALTRIREGEDETWLLLKRRDDDADAGRNLGAKPTRVGSVRTDARRVLTEAGRIDPKALKGFGVSRNPSVRRCRQKNAGTKRFA